MLSADVCQIELVEMCAYVLVHYQQCLCLKRHLCHITANQAFPLCMCGFHAKWLWSPNQFSLRCTRAAAGSVGAMVGGRLVLVGLRLGIAWHGSLPLYIVEVSSS